MVKSHTVSHIPLTPVPFKSAETQGILVISLGSGDCNKLLISLQSCDTQHFAGTVFPVPPQADSHITKLQTKILKLTMGN